MLDIHRNNVLSLQKKEINYTESQKIEALRVMAGANASNIGPNISNSLLDETSRGKNRKVVWKVISYLRKKVKHFHPT